MSSDMANNREPFRIDRAESVDLGFAMECLLAGAVTKPEFRDWLYLVFEVNDEVPFWLFDILDVPLDDQGYVTRMPIPFAPTSGLTTTERNAESGIAYRRFGVPIAYDLTIHPNVAERDLAMSECLISRFRRFFPGASM